MATKLTLAQELEGVLDEAVKSAVPQLPDYLAKRFEDYLILQEELDTLVETLHQRGGMFQGRIGRKMSRVQYVNYDARIHEIQFQMRGLINAAKAVRSGYQQYSVPKDWYAGYAELPKGSLWNSGFRVDGKSSELSWQFKAPMPDEVLAKWEEAKKTGLFTHYIVAAPERSLFEQVASLLCEPALVGYVPQETQGMRFSTPFERKQGFGAIPLPGLLVRNGTGFLIAMWDLEKDREYMGIN